MEKQKIDTKRLLKKMADVRCVCKRQKSTNKRRMKFGTSPCDTYSMDYTLGTVIANSLYQYIISASQVIVREDWAVIEKHADAINVYSKADSWDALSTNKAEKRAYMQKKKDWEEAMKWLTKEWQGLWW